MVGFWSWMVLLLYQVEDTSTRLWIMFFAHGFCGLLHLQITLSHFSSPTHSGKTYSEANEEHFIKQQLKTTTDWVCPKYFDWFHGGLQFQVAHHIFPRVPRHNLRKLTYDYLVPFCA